MRIRTTQRYLVAIVLSILFQFLLLQNIVADHLPAIPRNVTETRIGPFELGKTLPDQFLGCKPFLSAGDLDYLAFFENPDDQNHSLRVTVDIGCLNRDGSIVSCSFDSKEVVAGISVETEPPYTPFEEAESRCKLPISVRQLQTSRGIRVGDPLKKVLHAYGPPSTSTKELQTGKESHKPYYIIYTKHEMTGLGREFDFQIKDGIVIGIRVCVGE